MGAQVLAQSGAEPGVRYRSRLRGRITDVVRHQLQLAIIAATGCHDGITNAGGLPERVFHIAQLDAHAADLHLEVLAAQQLQHPVCGDPADITRVVEARAVQHAELLGHQFRAIEIARHQAVAREVDFTRHTQRSQVPLGIQHADRDMLEGPTDEGAGSACVSRGAS